MKPGKEGRVRQEELKGWRKGGRVEACEEGEGGMGEGMKGQGKGLEGV